MDATITFVSRKPIQEVPEYLSTGSYSVKDFDGNIIHFDWKVGIGNSDLLSDGRAIIEFKLHDFDFQLYDEYNAIPFPGFEELSSFELYEVSYKASMDEVAQHPIVVDLASFVLYDSNGDAYAFHIPRDFDINKTDQ